MQLSISRETLLKALRHTQNVVEKRTSIAILSNVKLSASKDQLEMTATDNDMTVQGSAEAFVEKEGTTTVGAHKLFEIINKIPEGVMVGMQLSDDGNRLNITAGKAKFQVAALDAKAFPDMTKVTSGVKFKLNSSEVKKLMSKALFASATDETRAYLNGIYLHVVKNEEGDQVLRAAATDGHRLARVDSKMPEGAADMQGIIIPRKTVNELRKLAEDSDEINFTVSDRLLKAEAGSLTLTSKLVDGNFPDYTKVIPTGNPLDLGVSAKQLLQAVDRVATLSHEKSRSIKFSLDVNNLLITANNPDQENAAEELKVDFDGSAMDVGFNARYVADIGQQIEGDAMRFSFKDAQSPVIVTDPTDASALYVVMPMRV